MGEWREDPLDELARELRQGAGADLRAEAEITELEAHQGRLRRRNLADLASEAMHRGDRVSLITADRTLTGEIAGVGKDYLVIETGEEVVDARLDAGSLRFVRRSSGGVSGSPGSATFKARLAEYEQTGESVELVAPEISFADRGRVKVTAADHVVFETEDESTVHVPLGRIAMILRPRPAR